MIDLFPTQIYPQQHTDPAIIEEIDNTISYLEETGDWQHSSYLSPYAMQETLHGTHAKQHLLQLFKKHPMPKLETFLGEAVEHYVSNTKLPVPDSASAYIEPLKGAWTISQSWINVCPKGKAQVRHTHAGHQVSGVYYHRTTPEMGGNLFYNPNPYSKMCMFGTEEGIYFEPTPQSVILFPSWLEHATEKNNTDLNRYSIAFNVHLY